MLKTFEERKQRLVAELEKGSVRMLHFKGNIYMVLGIVEHTETGEELVAYKRILSTIPNDPILGKLWVRPIEMFLSETDLEAYPDCQFDYRFMFEDEAISELTQLLGAKPAEMRQIPDIATFHSLQAKYGGKLFVERKENPSDRFMVIEPTTHETVFMNRLVNGEPETKEISFAELKEQYQFPVDPSYVL